VLLVRQSGLVPRYLLLHTHGRDDCSIAFAAWRGYESPLRHERAAASCSNSTSSEHRIWWELEATSGDQALAQLPPWVAERTEVNQIDEVTIP
jgi:hypothetical protein